MSFIRALANHSGEASNKDIGDFPLEVFPQYLIDYINAVHKSTNKNRLMTIAGIMSAYASANGKYYQVLAGETWLEKTIFWIVVSANSGMGKSPGISPTLKPLKDYDNNLKDKWRSEWEMIDKKPAMPRLIATDATIEALIKVHGENEDGLLLHQDEMDGFFSSMGAYKSGNGASADAAQYNSMFNGGGIEKIRVKSHSVSLKETCVNVLGGIQPQIIKQHLSKYSDNGFVFRFLPFMIEEEYNPINLMAPKIDQSAYNNAINNLLANRGTGMDPKVLRFDKTALEMLNKYLNELEAEKNKYRGTIIPAVYSKMQYYLIRLCLLIELMYDQYPKYISVKSFICAQSLFKWFLNQSLSFVYSSKNGHKRGNSKMEIFLKSKMHEGVQYKKQDIVEMLKPILDNISERTISDLVQSAPFLIKAKTRGYYIINTSEDDDQ